MIFDEFMFMNMQVNSSTIRREQCEKTPNLHPA